ncbi:hypothetical protein D6817_00295 [Candidatus Pacearchaeota archaeon]|nr:MAG: hypothetical protein D6817_00295 [Candidatus Pacearchaeota archaeon]
MRVKAVFISIALFLAIMSLFISHANTSGYAVHSASNSATLQSRASLSSSLSAFLSGALVVFLAVSLILIYDE